MNIATPYARLMNFDEAGNQVEFTLKTGIGLLRKIEWNARLSHASEDAQTSESWKRFIETVVMGHGDWSVVEHASVTVDMVVDRGISHEWVRHRLFSFTQSSTRFINYAKKKPPEFVRPPLEPSQSIDDGMSLNEKRRMAGEAWDVFIEQAELAYMGLVSGGIAPQIARSVLPNALATRISTTGNLRNWRHAFLMRTTREAHPQIRQVTIPLLAEFQDKIPLLFQDIEPLERQSENLKKPR
jgi:thymidylate synthase (FAD)